MDGAIAAGLISGGIVLGVNAIGWALTLTRGSNQEAKLRGAFEQKLTDICKTVDNLSEKVDKVNDKVDLHIVNHPGKRVRT